MALRVRAHLQFAVRTDLALDASAVWPDQSTTRAEVCLRVRDLAMPDPADDVHDVTVTAGVGVALADRDHLRALPGFAGLAVKDGDQRTVLAVREWSLGVSP